MNILDLGGCEVQHSPKECGSDTSVKGQLERTKARLEKQLAKVNAGLTVLQTDSKFSDNIETLLKAMLV